MALGCAWLVLCMVVPGCDCAWSFSDGPDLSILAIVYNFNNKKQSKSVNDLKSIYFGENGFDSMVAEASFRRTKVSGQIHDCNVAEDVDNKACSAFDTYLPTFQRQYPDIDLTTFDIVSQIFPITCDPPQAGTAHMSGSPLKNLIFDGQMPQWNHRWVIWHELAHNMGLSHSFGDVPIVGHSDCVNKKCKNFMSVMVDHYYADLGTPFSVSERKQIGWLKSDDYEDIRIKGNKKIERSYTLQSLSFPTGQIADSVVGVRIRCPCCESRKRNQPQPYDEGGDLWISFYGNTGFSRKLSADSYPWDEGNIGMQNKVYVEFHRNDGHRELWAKLGRDEGDEEVMKVSLQRSTKLRIKVVSIDINSGSAVVQVYSYGDKAKCTRRSLLLQVPQDVQPHTHVKSFLAPGTSVSEVVPEDADMMSMLQAVMTEQKGQDGGCAARRQKETSRTEG